MTFKNAVLNTPVYTTTTNGMKALESSLSSVVNLFFSIGASRGKDITGDLRRAYHEDRESTLRVLQWARDVRGGAGERDLFRQGLKLIEREYTSDLLETKILFNIPEIGRWDDLLIFENPEVKAKAFGIIRDALEAGNGLAAKWMPRKGKQAFELREFLGWSPKFYRKTLVNLTKVVETQMCAKEWDGINFSHVPSLAMSRYSKAFGKNAPDAFTAYKEALAKGKPEETGVKINAGAIYPYDVLKNVKHGDAALADEQWKALPNYVGDAMALPLVDVSDSMTCRLGGTSAGVTLTCLDIAISLGLYLADKNTGPFHDLFLTFSSKSKFEHLKGTLSQKYRQLSQADWEGSTNLESAFNEILRVATSNKVAPEDMPKVLLILSDMQFNPSSGHSVYYPVSGYNQSSLEMITNKYLAQGYKVPNLVYWNLNAHDNVPVRFDERGTALVSGFSPAIMKAVLSGNMDDMSPVGIMKKAINSDRYAI